MAISFGMVNIPGKLYLAASDKDYASLCNIHKTCGTAVQAPKYCPTCKVMLTPEEMGKAYPEDSKKTKLYPITEEEMAGLPLKSLHTIQVDGFLPVEQLDLRYPEKAYVFEAEEIGFRAFALFENVMKLEPGKVWIGKVTVGTKESLCAIRPTGDGLMYVQALHWASEIRNSEQLQRPNIQISDKELAMAKLLIETLPQVNLKDFEDDYGKALNQLVAAKKAGSPLPVQSAAPVQKEDDLMATIMASLNAAKSLPNTAEVVATK